MKHFRLFAAFAFCGITPSEATDPLPSWNDTAPKKAITAFVEKVTTKGSPDFVPVPERIAVFDNDGTLWSEEPVFFMAYFVEHAIKAKAARHPEWVTEEPYASVLKGDIVRIISEDEEGAWKLLAAAHSGMTTEEFAKSVDDWATTARHPKTGKLFTEMVFQPMLELLKYLRANEFKTYIVSGGGIEFMRQWSERVYGVPPEQVIGSYGKLKYEARDGKPVILKLPALMHYNDDADKPAAIQTFIGRRPIAAFGNADSDYPILEWTTRGAGPRFGLIVHHDDGKREFAYDRDSPMGKLSKGLDDAGSQGWVVTSMKNDWSEIYPPTP